MHDTPRDGALQLTRDEFVSDPSLPIEVQLRDPQPPFPKHSHAFDELVVVLQGTALHEVDRQQFAIRTGDVFVIGATQVHEYRDRNHLALANVLFDMGSLDMEHWDIRALPGFHTLFALEPQLRGPNRPLGRLQLNAQQLVHAAELIQQLDTEIQTKPQGYRVMARGLFSQLVVYLSRCYSDMPTSDALDLLRLGDAIAYIETHYPDHMTLEELSRTAHMSPRHFQRLFRRTTGHPPFEHLLRVRLRHAAELLRNSTRTITDIAYSCGFRDSNYFSRCFRQYMEQSPSHYRHSHT